MTSGPTLRKIIHVDMDAFFASVEQRDRPEWKGLPIIVGGPAESRGVVCSASYEARKFGVRSAMSSAKAKRLCPQAIFVHPRFDAYYEASQRLREIFHEVTDLVEPLSLDEAYLDVTENKWNEPLAGRIAIRIREEIKKRLSLTASAGVASTLFLAKIASDQNKPDGLTIIPPEKALDFIAGLPVARLWGVGPATEERLHKLGIRLAKDFRDFPDSTLEQELGKSGLFLKGLSLGIDPRTVDPEGERKSYGSERTFSKDVTDSEILDSTLGELSRDVASSLKADGLRAKTFTLKIRYSDFETITRSLTLHRFTDDGGRVHRDLARLLSDKTEAGLRPVRLIGASASQLLHEGDPEQLWFPLPEFS